MKTIGRTFKPVEEPVYKCPYCDKQYQTEANLKKHIAEKHGDQAENTSGNTPEE